MFNALYKFEVTVYGLRDIPTVASLKILGYPLFGYLPRSCQTSKKGFQSMYEVRREMS